jgi:hypothetical protein
MKSLYFYKNDKGYLVIDGETSYHTDKIYKGFATIKPNEQIALKGNYKIEKISVEEFSKMYSPIISQMVVVGDVLFEIYKNYNENFPIIPGNHKVVRNAIRNAKEKAALFHNQVDEILKDEHTNHDDFFEQKACFYELVINISELLENGNISDLNNVFKAYKKDPKSIEGITKKILK